MAPAAATMEMLSPADVQELAESSKRDAFAFVQAHKIEVIDVASCQDAANLRKVLGEKIKTVETRLAPAKSWAHKLHAWFCDLERDAIGPLRQLDAFEQSSISEFNAAQRRVREAEERRIAEAQQREAQDRAAAEAAHFESAGQHEMAEAVVAEAIAAPAPVVVLPTLAQQVTGLKFRRTWKWRFSGNNEARAMTLIPREYLCVDEKRLNKYATAMREAAKVPGIEFFYEDVPVR